MIVTLATFFFLLGFAFAVLNSKNPKGTHADVTRFLSNLKSIGSGLWSGTSVKTTSVANDAAQNEKDVEQGMKYLLTKAQVEEKYDEDSWERRCYEEFRDKMTDRSAVFPCVYATAGYKADDHRYVFVSSSDPSTPSSIRVLGPAMRAYLHLAPSLGKNTSLVIMCAETSVTHELDVYTDRFWQFLRGLRIFDTEEWPRHVPTKTTHSEWTFCYAGESVFPIALTPAHSHRQSRYARNLIIAMQPKWVIDELLATDEKREAAQNKVRALLRKYDMADVSSDLTAYGADGSSESRQLVLTDDDTSSHIPFEDLDL